MAGAKVGDPDMACTIVEARVQKCIRESVAREWRGSRAVVPMAPGVQSGVVEGGLESGEGGHGTRIWSYMRDGAAGEQRWRRR